MNSLGIDYYPFNVDFFGDDKMQLIEAEFGIKGSYIAIRLLCKIYHEGYYYQWGDDECLLFSKNIGNGIVPNTVKEVLSGLVKRSFFDKGVFDSFNVLTSRGIQTRYFEAARRRKIIEVNKDFLLVDVSKYDNVYIIDKNVDINDKNVDIFLQKKRKYSKVKETNSNELEKKKQEQAKKLAAAKAATLSRRDSFYNSLIPYTERYSKTMIREFYDYWSELTKSETKMRFETEKTWEVGKRLATWAKRDPIFNKNNKKSNEQEEEVYIVK